MRKYENWRAVVFLTPNEKVRNQEYDRPPDPKLRKVKNGMAKS